MFLVRGKTVPLIDELGIVQRADTPSVPPMALDASSPAAGLDERDERDADEATKRARREQDPYASLGLPLWLVAMAVSVLMGSTSAFAALADADVPVVPARAHVSAASHTEAVLQLEGDVMYEFPDAIELNEVRFVTSVVPAVGGQSTRP